VGSEYQSHAHRDGSPFDDSAGRVANHALITSAAKPSPMASVQDQVGDNGIAVISQRPANTAARCQAMHMPAEYSFNRMSAKRNHNHHTPPQSAAAMESRSTQFSGE
jgi:hypothetical protein